MVALPTMIFYSQIVNMPDNGQVPPSQSWRPTSTTPCPQYRDQSHPFHDAPRPIFRNVGLRKFDGKMDEWENWSRQFRVFTQLYNWTENEQLIHLLSSLRGPALTAHRSFSEADCATVEACTHALNMRYGSKRPLTIASLLADLSVAKQEEGERVDTFGDRLLGLTHRAFPRMAPDWIQGLSVPAFLKGLKYKVSGQEAMKFGKPQTITDAVNQVMHLQCTARTVGGHQSITNRHVVFNDDVPEAIPLLTPMWKHMPNMCKGILTIRYALPDPRISGANNSTCLVVTVSVVSHLSSLIRPRLSASRCTTLDNEWGRMTQCCHLSTTDYCTSTSFPRYMIWRLDVTVSLVWGQCTYPNC